MRRRIESRCSIADTPCCESAADLLSKRDGALFAAPLGVCLYAILSTTKPLGLPSRQRFRTSSATWRAQMNESKYSEAEGHD
eukprot:1369184-Prymnesium_polylepis.1